MATATLRPNETVSNAWTVTNAATAHEALDDAVLEPTAGSEADGYLSVSSTNTACTLGLSAPNDVLTATLVEAKIYALTSTDEDIRIEVLNNGAVVGTSFQSSPATSYGWHTHAVSGLTLAQSDVDNLQLRLTSVKVGGGGMGSLRLAAAYATLTYTAQTLPTNLIVNDATHAHAAESPALTQSFALSVADGVHAHTSETVTLTVAGSVLVIAESQHSHTAENPALSQIHYLIVADGFSGHSADAVALGQSYLLAIDSALHVLEASEVRVRPAIQPLLDEADALIVAAATFPHSRRAHDELVEAVCRLKEAVESLHIKVIDLTLRVDL